MRIPPAAGPAALAPLFILIPGLLGPASAALLAQTETEDLMSRVDPHLEARREALIEIRRDIHRHPEVSGEEERTAGVVAERLESLGFEVMTGIGGYGVLGVLRGGRPGPVVAFRADMDAVPSSAPDPVAFASMTPGVRHICGHDIHTTVGIALAEALAAIREDLPGTVKLIFQPAEENIQGARAMIEDGALEDPAPEVIFAFHTAPLEVGQIGSVEGLSLPGLDRVTVTIRGSGDLDRAAADYATALRSLSTGQNVPPEEFVMAMIGSSRADSAGERVIGGMIRAGSPAARAKVRKQIEAELAAVSVDDVAYELRYDAEALPDMVNDPELVRSTLAAIRSVVGEEGLLEVNEVTPYFSEDFSLYQQHIPGAMYWLGASNSEHGTVSMPHSPDFVADEEAILVGAKVMTAVILDYMERY
jgi:amidohydrolase